MGMDDPTDMSTLRAFFARNAKTGHGNVSTEGDVLNAFDPKLTITSVGGDVTQIDAEFEGHIARKRFTYPDANTQIIWPWEYVS